MGQPFQQRPVQDVEPIGCLPQGNQGRSRQQAAQDDATARAAVITLIESCVGLTWQNLTAAQKQSMIVALLYKLHALDKTLTVQPLADWL